MTTYTKAEKAMAKKILRYGRNLVRDGWTQEAWARNSEGEYTGVRSPEACEFCAEGALQRAGYDLQATAAEVRLANQRLSYVMGGWGILARNDAPRTTQAQVYGSFDLAYRGAAPF